MPAYRYSDYINPLVGRIADSLGSSNDARARGIANAGQATARGQELSGLAWSRAASDIANTGAGMIQDVQQAKAQQKQQQSVQALLKQTPRVDLGGGVMGYDIPTITDALMQSGADPKPIVDRLGPVNTSLQQMHTARANAARITAQAVHDAGNDPDLALSAIDTFEANGVIGKEQAAQFRTMTQLPGGVAKMTSYFIGQDKTERPVEHDPEKELRDVSGNLLVPATPKPVARKTTTINGQLVDAETGDPIGKPIPAPPPAVNPETERHNKELERIANLTAGRTAAAQAETVRHDKAMEESARNRVTARPVLSGDANRIADIDTGLTQLGTLSGQDTGVGSALAASVVPDFVTQWTGLGADSKGRQAMIETVKQIIGKGMEGGVLRKEDEIKYARIMPKIGDPPEVAAIKIKQISEMLKNKREQVLESLSDANYDVSKFQARTPKAPETPAASAQTERIRVIGPNGERGTVPKGTALGQGWRQE